MNGRVRRLVTLAALVLAALMALAPATGAAPSPSPTASDSAGTPSDSATVSPAPAPILTVAPDLAAPGSTVTLNGTGWSPKTSRCEAVFDQQLSVPCTIDSSGTLSSTGFQIPADLKPGKYAVVACQPGCGSGRIAARASAASALTAAAELTVEDQVSVPDLRKLTYEQAVSLAEQQGLTVSPRPRDPSWLINGQKPRPGTKVFPNTAISVAYAVPVAQPTPAAAATPTPAAQPAPSPIVKQTADKEKDSTWLLALLAIPFLVGSAASAEWRRRRHVRIKQTVRATARPGRPEPDVSEPATHLPDIRVEAKTGPAGVHIEEP